MKRKQNSAEKVKRKLTVWQYQYDNGEAGIECDWLTVIKTVREQQPDYLVGKSRNVRLPVDGESRLCATLVLSVEKLSWLSDEAQNMLLDLIALIAPQK